jgi:hypothetical protein
MGSIFGRHNPVRQYRESGTGPDRQTQPKLGVK